MRASGMRASGMRGSLIPIGHGRVIFPRSSEGFIVGP